MTDITDITHIPTVLREKPAQVTLPAPVLFSTPILISDCTSPLGGETILSLLWRRLDGSDENARPR
ncbi:hypothetical protein [Yoonia sp. 2307UL14-13]|uniref:hypothetical protein n=1 Tax=Yoonia sp. 2307UL14-13 TaxID=3126506 RepID=UPI0030B7A086